MRVLEKIAEKKFVAYCKLKKIICKKFICRGFPDRIIFLKGAKTIFIEFKASADTKTKEGKLSEQQKLTIKHLKALDFKVSVFRTFEQARDFLHEEMAP